MTALAKLPTVDELAQEIRRVDGNHSLGAGALAEALMPFLAALSPAELGGVAAWGVIDQNDEIFEVLLTKACAENWLDYECDGQTTKAIVPLYTTPRAAEAVSEAELAEVIQRHTGCADSDSIYAAVAVLQALTPPAAKGE